MAQSDPATGETKAVLAMKSLIESLPEGRQRGCALEACLQLAWRLWGWNVERFRDELAKASS